MEQHKTMAKSARLHTVRDVAERAGVAISSVSRVFSGHPNVTPELRRRVLAAAKAEGYEPDRVARSLRQGFTQTVGFIVRDISNPLFADIAKGAEDRLRAGGYAMILTNSEGQPELDAEYISLLRQRRVDGLIVSVNSETYAPTVRALKNRQLPLVLLDRVVEGVAASAVLCDHYSGVRAATRHMLALGHRRIAIISGPPTIIASRERVRGFKDAHKDAGVSWDRSLGRLGGYDSDFGYEEAKSLLLSAQPPTGIVSGGIQLSIGVISAVRDVGLRIGRDVSIVSCDETALMKAFDPPISVVLRDTREMGHLAAEMLLETIAGAKPRTITIPTRYVPRESVGPVPQSHATLVPKRRSTASSNRS
jgi:LacI family transcriptional regulator